MSKEFMMTRWIAILILLIACGLRFYRLETQSFWNDEGNSARLSERSLDLIVEGTASDIHPPLYYIALRGWRELVGDSEFGLRSFSAFLGVGLTALTLALGRLWFHGQWDRPVPLIAAFLVAINPTMIYYSQETRMYLLLPFLATLQSWLLWRWYVARDPRMSLLVSYVLVAGAGLYTHYFYPIFLLVHNLIVASWLLIYWRTSWWPRVRQWASMMVATLLLYAVWIPIFLRQAGGRPGEEMSLTSFGRDIIEFLLVGIGNELPLWLPLVPLIVLLLAALWHMRQRWLFVAILAFVPLFSLWLVGTTSPAFYKFSLLAYPPLALLLAVGIAVLWRRRWTAFMALGLSGLFLWSSAGALDNQYHEAQYARADYRAMAERIASEGHPNAGIVLNAANQWEVFTYYHQAGADVYPLPRGAVAPELVEAELQGLVAEHDRLYAIFWGESGRDPERRVERFLDEQTFKAVDQWYGDVRFVMYAVPPLDAEAEMRAAPLPEGGLLFAGQIVLLTAQLPERALLPGDILPLRLQWQALQPLNERYKIFLHLVDSGGNIVAQRDSEPGGGLALTTGWQTGVAVVDNHGILLPLDLPAGRYTIRLGLYDLINPDRRLPLADGAEWWDLITIDLESGS